MIYTCYRLEAVMHQTLDSGSSHAGCGRDMTRKQSPCTVLKSVCQVCSISRIEVSAYCRRNTDLVASAARRLIMLSSLALLGASVNL